MKKLFIAVLGALSLLTACRGGGDYTPKPTAYPRIDYPAKSYKLYDSACPFTFKVPVYARVAQDRSPGSEPCWLNVEFPSFNATLHLSYKPATGFKNVFAMTEDARNFAYKHTVKASDIVDSPYSVRKGVGGMFFNIEGNTASSVQFYTTDSVKHYMRGALYFNIRPNADSAAPVLRFLKADIDTMLRSLQWK